MSDTDSLARQGEATTFSIAGFGVHLVTSASVSDEELAALVEEAQPGDTILVRHYDAKLRLGLLLQDAGRVGKVTVEVESQTSPTVGWVGEEALLALLDRWGNAIQHLHAVAHETAGVPAPVMRAVTQLFDAKWGDAIATAARVAYRELVHEIAQRERQRAEALASRPPTEKE